MSGIFKRLREPTGLEFWDLAVEIERNITRFMMREKNVPKKYRYVFAVPIINLTQELRRNIVCANSIYPYNEHELQRRKDFQQDAININEFIIQQIQDMINILTEIDADKLDSIGNMLMKESTLLRAWKKSSKILSK